jgi:outer membrane lipoprotein-sorting protein
MFGEISLGTNNKHDYSKEASLYLKGIKCLKSDFVQRNADGQNENWCNGCIYIVKDKEGQKIKIEYEESVKTEILVQNDIVTIINLKTKEQTKHSIKQTAIYDILNNGIDFEKRKSTIKEEDEHVYITVQEIVPSGCTDITFVFSKYENCNLKNFEGWIIKEQNEVETDVCFLPDTLKVNDKSGIPAEIFSATNLAE